MNHIILDRFLLTYKTFFEDHLRWGTRNNSFKPCRKKTFFVFLLIFFRHCDLENRYPESGSFCIPMKEIPECVQIDFRNKLLIFNEQKLQLKMINRVQYEKIIDTKKIEMEVLSEHRIRIRTLHFPELKIEKEETYLRIKEKRISIWSAFKKWRDKRDN